jgi:hypothetical protein
LFTLTKNKKGKSSQKTGKKVFVVKNIETMPEKIRKVANDRESVLSIDKCYNPY